MEKEYKGDLILLRGLPGSGKTTLGQIILKSFSTDIPNVLSADDFFINEQGEYIFDVQKLKEAHTDCQIRCSNKMKNEIHRIVVANTFTQEWEMNPYFDMAERYNYRVHTVVVENRHDGKNIHEVPEDKLQQMKNRFEIKL
jgi:predicted kinase